MTEYKIKHLITKISIPLFFLSIVWFFFILQQQEIIKLVPNGLGIVPRTFLGLGGIIMSPFFHGNFNHILNNTTVVLPLMILLFLFHKKPLKIFLIIWFFSGLGTWIFGNNTIVVSSFIVISSVRHIGMSGIGFGLLFYLMINHLLQKSIVNKIVSICLFLIMFTSFLYIVPNPFVDLTGISWQGHLSGAIIGTILAVYYRNNKTLLDYY